MSNHQETSNPPIDSVLIRVPASLHEVDSVGSLLIIILKGQESQDYPKPTLINEQIFRSMKINENRQTLSNFNADLGTTIVRSFQCVVPSLALNIDHTL